MTSQNPKACAYVVLLMYTAIMLQLCYNYTIKLLISINVNLNLSIHIYIYTYIHISKPDTGGHSN